MGNMKFLEKRDKFVIDNKEILRPLVHLSWSPSFHKENKALIHRMKSEIGYSKSTAHCDIWRSIRTTYKSKFDKNGK